MITITELIRARCNLCNFVKDYNRGEGFPTTCPACKDGGKIFTRKEGENMCSGFGQK